MGAEQGGLGGSRQGESIGGGPGDEGEGTRRGGYFSEPFIDSTRLKRRIDLLASPAETAH